MIEATVARNETRCTCRRSPRRASGHVGETLESRPALDMQNLTVSLSAAARWRRSSRDLLRGLPIHVANPPEIRVVSQFELLIATFPTPHNLSSDVMSMIRRF